MNSTSQKDIFRRLWSLSLPIIGLNVLNVLSLAIDTAMCGRLPHAKQSLTALSFATQVIWLLMVAMIGLTVGTVALVSRAYGAKEHERVNHLLHQSSMLTVLLGIFVGVVGNILAGPILTMLGATPEVRDLGLLYMRPLLIGAPFYYLVIMLGGVLRGVGNTRLPFMIAIVTNLINAGINYCLILGNFGFPAWGLQGAAIGTLASYLAGAFLMIWLVKRRTIPNLKLSLRPRTIDWPLTKQLVGIGTPAALDMVILNAAFMSLVGMLGRIDEAAVAAHGIGLRIQALAFVPGMSISQATGALIGQALGAGDPERAKQIVRASLVFCFSVMTLLALGILLWVTPIIQIFRVQPGTALGEFAITWIKLLGYGMPIVGIHIAFVGMLQGAGKTQVSLNINMATTLLFQIPLSAFLGFTMGWGAFGVWVAFPATFLLKVACDLIVYKQDKWAQLGVET